MLGFLTRSGWIYWDKGLFKKRVIVDQKWALGGIYAALDRDDDIYKTIARNRGRFTRSDLVDLCWTKDGKARYSNDEQATILSFMEQCDLIFKVHGREESRRGEDVYVSFEHLSPGGLGPGLDGYAEGDGKAVSVESVFASKGLHKGQWQRLLVSFGRQYENDADYYSDGIQLFNRDGQRVRIWREIEPTGIGGTIGVSVKQVRDASELSSDRLYGRPHSVRERFGRVVAFVKEIVKDIDWSEKAEPLREESEALPGRKGIESDKVGGPQEEVLDVFVSYTWNPKRNAAGDLEIEAPVDYEKPVDLIEERFKRWEDSSSTSRFRAILLRDAISVSLGGDILKFMNNSCKSSKVIVVHSDKYFYSTCCMYELYSILNEFTDTSKHWSSVVIPVGLEDSQIATMKRAKYRKFWEAAPENLAKWVSGDAAPADSPIAGVSERAFWIRVSEGMALIGVEEESAIRARVAHFLTAFDMFAKRASRKSGWNMRWNSDDPEKTLASIEARLRGTEIVE